MIKKFGEGQYASFARGALEAYGAASQDFQPVIERIKQETSDYERSELMKSLDKSVPAGKTDVFEALFMELSEIRQNRYVSNDPRSVALRAIARRTTAEAWGAFIGRLREKDPVLVKYVTDYAEWNYLELTVHQLAVLFPAVFSPRGGVTEQENQVVANDVDFLFGDKGVLKGDGFVDDYRDGKKPNVGIRSIVEDPEELHQVALMLGMEQGSAAPASAWTISAVRAFMRRERTPGKAYETAGSFRVSMESTLTGLRKIIDMDPALRALLAQAESQHGLLWKLTLASPEARVAFINQLQSAADMLNAAPGCGSLLTLMTHQDNGDPFRADLLAQARKIVADRNFVITLFGDSKRASDLTVFLNAKERTLSPEDAASYRASLKSSVTDLREIVSLYPEMRSIGFPEGDEPGNEYLPKALMGATEAERVEFLRQVKAAAGHLPDSRDLLSLTTAGSDPSPRTDIEEQALGITALEKSVLAVLETSESTWAFVRWLHTDKPFYYLTPESAERAARLYRDAQAAGLSESQAKGIIVAEAKIPGLKTGMTIDGRSMRTEDLVKYIRTNRKFRLPGYFEYFMDRLSYKAGNSGQFDAGWRVDPAQAQRLSYENLGQMTLSRWKTMIAEGVFSGNFAVHRIHHASDSSLEEAILRSGYIIGRATFEKITQSREKDNVVTDNINRGKVNPLGRTEFVHTTINETPYELLSEPIFVALPVEVELENHAYDGNPLLRKGDWAIKGYSRDVEHASHRVLTRAGLICVPKHRQQAFEALLEKIQAENPEWQRPEVFYYQGEQADEGTPQLRAELGEPREMVVSRIPAAIGELELGSFSREVYSIKDASLRLEDRARLTRYEEPSTNIFVDAEGRQQEQELTSVREISGQLEDLATAVVEGSGLKIHRANGRKVIDTGSSVRGTYHERFRGLPDDFDLMAYIDGAFPTMELLQQLQASFVETLKSRSWGHIFGGDAAVRVVPGNIKYDPEKGYALVQFDFYEGAENNVPVLSIDLCVYNTSAMNDGIRYQQKYLENMDKLLSAIRKNEGEAAYQEAKQHVLTVIRTVKEMFKNEGAYKRWEGGLRGVGTEQLVMQLNGVEDPFGTPKAVATLAELKQKVSVDTALDKLLEASFDNDGNFEADLGKVIEKLVLYDPGASEPGVNLAKGLNNSSRTSLAALALDNQDKNARKVATLLESGNNIARSEAREFSRQDREKLLEILDAMSRLDELGDVSDQLGAATMELNEAFADLIGSDIVAAPYRNIPAMSNEELDNKLGRLIAALGGPEMKVQSVPEHKFLQVLVNLREGKETPIPPFTRSAKVPPPEALLAIPLSTYQPKTPEVQDYFDFIEEGNYSEATLGGVMSLLTAPALVKAPVSDIAMDAFEVVINNGTFDQFAAENPSAFSVKNLMTVLLQYDIRKERCYWAIYALKAFADANSEAFEAPEVQPQLKRALGTLISRLAMPAGGHLLTDTTGPDLEELVVLLSVKPNALPVKDRRTVAKSIRDLLLRKDAQADADFLIPAFREVAKYAALYPETKEIFRETVRSYANPDKYEEGVVDAAVLVLQAFDARSEARKQSIEDEASEMVKSLFDPLSKRDYNAHEEGFLASNYDDYMKPIPRWSREKFEVVFFKAFLRAVAEFVKSGAWRDAAKKTDFIPQNFKWRGFIPMLEKYGFFRSPQFLKLVGMFVREPAADDQKKGNEGGKAKTGRTAAQGQRTGGKGSKANTGRRAQELTQDMMVQILRKVAHQEIRVLGISPSRIRVMLSRSGINALMSLALRVLMVLGTFIVSYFVGGMPAMASLLMSAVITGAVLNKPAEFLVRVSRDSEENVVTRNIANHVMGITPRMFAAAEHKLTEDFAMIDGHPNLQPLDRAMFKVAQKMLLSSLGTGMRFKRASKDARYAITKEMDPSAALIAVLSEIETNNPSEYHRWIGLLESSAKKPENWRSKVAGTVRRLLGRELPKEVVARFLELDASVNKLDSRALTLEFSKMVLPSKKAGKFSPRKKILKGLFPTDAHDVAAFKAWLAGHGSEKSLEGEHREVTALINNWFRSTPEGTGAYARRLVDKLISSPGSVQSEIEAYFLYLWVRLQPQAEGEEAPTAEYMHDLLLRATAFHQMLSSTETNADPDLLLTANALHQMLDPDAREKMAGSLEKAILGAKSRSETRQPGGAVDAWLEQINGVKTAMGQMEAKGLLVFMNRLTQANAELGDPDLLRETEKLMSLARYRFDPSLASTEMFAAEDALFLEHGAMDPIDFITQRFPALKAVFEVRFPDRRFQEYFQWHRNLTPATAVRSGFEVLEPALNLREVTELPGIRVKAVLRMVFLCYQAGLVPAAEVRSGRTGLVGDLEKSGFPLGRTASDTFVGDWAGYSQKILSSVMEKLNFNQREMELAMNLLREIPKTGGENVLKDELMSPEYTAEEYQEYYPDIAERVSERARKLGIPPSMLIKISTIFHAAMAGMQPYELREMKFREGTWYPSIDYRAVGLGNLADLAEQPVHWDQGDALKDYNEGLDALARIHQKQNRASVSAERPVFTPEGHLNLEGLMLVNARHGIPEVVNGEVLIYPNSAYGAAHPLLRNPRGIVEFSWNGVIDQWNTADVVVLTPFSKVRDQNFANAWYTATAHMGPLRLPPGSVVLIRSGTGPSEEKIKELQDLGVSVRPFGADEMAQDAAGRMMEEMGYQPMVLSTVSYGGGGLGTDTTWMEQGMGRDHFAAESLDRSVAESELLGKELGSSAKGTDQYPLGAVTLEMEDFFKSFSSYGHVSSAYRDNDWEKVTATQRFDKVLKDFERNLAAIPESQKSTPGWPLVRMYVEAYLELMRFGKRALGIGCEARISA